jgi:hypothetical protein
MTNTGGSTIPAKEFEGKLWLLADAYQQAMQAAYMGGVLAEREACASLCFQMWNEWMDNEYISELNRPDAEDCAHAIRKRGLHNLNKEAEKNGEEL